jgi:rhomboid protease GluP
MKDGWQQLDRIPVTLVVAIAYATLFVLTDIGKAPEQADRLLFAYGLLRPIDVVDGQPWRLFAAAFLHANWIHVGLNLLSLLALGPALELTLGSVRFAILYLVSALGGSIAVCLIYEPYGRVLGGSGALFGMMGCALALNMRAGRHLLQFLDFEGPRRLVALIVANLLIGLSVPMVSNTAHVGGLCAGFLLTFVWLAPGRARGSPLSHWRLALVALLASLSFWCVDPATRWDRLWLASLESPGTERQALRRAAAMAYLDRPQVSDGQTHGLDALGETVRRPR